MPPADSACRARGAGDSGGRAGTTPARRRPARPGEWPDPAGPSRRGRLRPPPHGSGAHSNGEISLSSARPAPANDTELAAEQGYVTRLHRRLDDVRARTPRRLADALATKAHNPQSVGEREAAVQLHSRAAGRARRRRERAVLRPAGPPGRRRAALRRPDRAARRRRRRGAAADRLAGTGGPAVLHGDPAARPRRAPPPAHPHPRPDGRLDHRRDPRPRRPRTSPSGRAWPASRSCSPP